MRIRRLKLTGFKSFVDSAELVIEPGLTGIVGPNGCGKSNLLEAIRWVMGEGSARSLRGGGMEDVIFAGTAQRPARDFAEVAMLLDRTDARGGAQEGEIVRRIERGAGSAYRVDGRDVRQKDVALLFADAATGAHSPALVSQGRIGAIIAARPADRRAMLEEAAGIAGLHVRRRDAELRLRATETNLERLDQLIGDMDGRAHALRRQARAAERYRLLSGEIRLAEARLIYARWRDAAAAAGAARRDAETAAHAVGQASDAQRIAGEAAAAAATTLAAARAAAQSARDAAVGAQHRLDTLERDRAALRRRIADAAALVETLERDRAREAALAEDAAVALARLDAEGLVLDRRLDEAAAARPALVEQLAAGEDALRDAGAALARALAAQAQAQADARIAEAAHAAARHMLDRAEQEVRRVAEAIAALGDAGAETDALADAVARRDDCAQAAARAAAAIAAAEAERAQAAAARDTAQAAASATRATLAALESEAAALARSQPHATTGRVLDRLMVTPGYERALAAALGDDLEAPVAATGAVRWQGTDAWRDRTIPGCDALSSFVEGVPQIARRLTQIGVVDVDDGSLRLATGQRLVTLDGQMRRWDGFVALDRGAATAERLVRRNRLAEIAARLPDLRVEAAEVGAAIARAAEALERATAAGHAARAGSQAAERGVRDALFAQDRARGAIERSVARRGELSEQAGRAERDHIAAAADHETACAALATLPDTGAATHDVADRCAASDAARVRVMQTRADLAALDRGLATDRDRRAATSSEAAGWHARAGDAARRIAEMARRAHDADAATTGLAGAPADLDRRIAEAQAMLEGATAAKAETERSEIAAAATLRGVEATLAEAGEAVARARETRATAAARVENHEQRRVEMGRIAGERFQCPAPMLPGTIGFDGAAVSHVADESRRLDKLTEDRERIGPVNLVAEQELAGLDAERLAQAAQRDELAGAVARLRSSIAALDREGRARLRLAFEAVDGHFRRLFALLFAGGEARLELVDSDDPLAAGLEIMAQPPGKRLTSLTLLSGGEQALTACALIFALFLTNPSPICVLDEVDAPLDDANIERFCDLLDQMVRETDTRYLVVTHNAVTMARMHRLFGVTMVERGVSRLVSVDLGGAQTLLAAE